jgi:hypothetical protein
VAFSPAPTPSFSLVDRNKIFNIFSMPAKRMLPFHVILFFSEQKRASHQQSDYQPTKILLTKCDKALIQRRKKWFIAQNAVPKTRIPRTFALNAEQAYKQALLLPVGMNAEKLNKNVSAFHMAEQSLAHF